MSGLLGYIGYKLEVIWLMITFPSIFQFINFLINSNKYKVPPFFLRRQPFGKY